MVWDVYRSQLIQISERYLIIQHPLILLLLLISIPLTKFLFLNWNADQERNWIASMLQQLVE